jgi:N-acetylmuramoyl-L-alanine amidase
MRLLKLFVICLLVPLIGSFTPLPKKEKIIIVIDPGHGGSDPGHTSDMKNIQPEKSLNLLIAKKFGAYIEQNLKNVTIIYTRTDDSFPTLDDRVAKANSVGADYFISVHCNANDRKTVHGTESHVHTMSAKKSVGLAQEFENEFSKKAGRHSRGVKDTEDREHSLQVLKYTNMTGVLVECGFLTNDDEAKYLNSASGQDVIASAMYRALKTFIVKEHPSISFIKTTPANTATNTATVAAGSDAGTYVIRIMSSKSEIDTGHESFKKLGMPVTRRKVEGETQYKFQYTVGSYTNKDAANKDLEKVKNSGFKDAYVIRL